MNRKPYRIIAIFDNLGLGGVQTKLVSLSNYLAARRDLAHVHLYIIVRKKPEFHMEDRIDTRTTTILHRPELIGTKLHIPFSLFFFWNVLVIKPHAVLAFFDVFSSFAVLASRLLFWRRIRVVISEDIFASRHTKSFFKHIVIRTCYPRADAVLCQTHATKHDLVTSFRIPGKNIHVIPNWTAITPKTNHAQRQYDLLYAGRFDKQKNMFCMLKVIKQLAKVKPAMRAVLIGEGPELAGMVRYIRHNKLEDIIRIMPSVHPIREYLDASKIFIHSSRYEGMSVGILEALGMGVPVVVKHHPGISEYVIHGKTGLIARTEHEMTVYLRQLLENPAKRRTLASRAIADVRIRFSAKPLAAFTDMLMRYP